ncbi:MAG TPA: acyl-CoA reductase [bacterium]|nr:acyl-CoA reductase [bacterium]
MTEETPKAYWIPEELQKILDRIPGGTTPFVKKYQRGDKDIAVSFLRLSPEALRTAAEWLKERRQQVLVKRPVREIAALLDRVADRWLTPSYEPRQRAIRLISAITGFSPEMVAHSIHLEQISSRGPHLIKALTNELGDPAFLDGFQKNDRLGGYSHAVGPELVGAIFSSNIPALPHLEIMRAFLVKAACLGRVSAGEPIFLSLYARTLAELDPELASCLAIVYWERGDDDAENAFLESINYLVAYGGEQQTLRLIKAKPASLEATWHGHKMGFIYVAKESLARSQAREVAHKVAYDFTVFDGHACLCPQVCLVDRDGEVSPEEFGKMCAEEMAVWAKELPPRSMDLSEAANKYRERELHLMRASQEDMKDRMTIIAAPEDYSCLVYIDRHQRFEPSLGERYVRIVPVGGVADVEAMVRPIRHYLQNAAIAAGEETFSKLRYTLARMGVTRVGPPGLMGTPSMMWHHDGNACLGKMLTWCDHERMLPEELLELQHAS